MMCRFLDETPEVSVLDLDLDGTIQGNVGELGIGAHEAQGLAGNQFLRSAFLVMGRSGRS